MAMKHFVLGSILLAVLPSLAASQETKAPDPEKPHIFSGLRRSSLKEIPQTRFLFWADFTAGKVEFR